MIIVVIIFFLIQLLMLGYLVYKIGKHKSLTLKDTFIYPFLVILTTILICVIKKNTDTSEDFFKDVANGITDSVNIVKLTINKELIKLLESRQGPEKVLLYNYYMSYVISLIALLSLSITLLRIAIVNFWRIHFMRIFRRKEQTYIFGFNEDAKKFVKNLTYKEKRKCVVVLDSTGLDKYVDEKIYLGRYKIPYIMRKYTFVADTKKTISRLAWWTKKINIITFFDDESKNITFVALLKELLVEKEYCGGYWQEECVEDGNKYLIDHGKEMKVSLNSVFVITPTVKIKEKYPEKEMRNFVFNCLVNQEIEKLKRQNKEYDVQNVKNEIEDYINKVNLGEAYKRIKWRPLSFCSKKPVNYNASKHKYVYVADNKDKEISIVLTADKVENVNNCSPYDISSKYFKHEKQEQISIKYNFSFSDSNLNNFFDINFKYEKMCFSKSKDINIIISCNKSQEETLNNLIVNEETSESKTSSCNNIDTKLENGKETKETGQFKNYYYGNWSVADENNNIDYSFGKIRTFNKYDIISFDFVKRHSFARFIKKENINSDLTLNNCDVNLYVLGFGKINESLLRDILITNQFAERKEESEGHYKLSPKRINVEIYDDNRKIESLDFSSGFLKYDKAEFDNDKYFELPTKYLSIDNFHTYSSVEEPGFINSIYDLIKSKANGQRTQYNFFLISLDTDSMNWNVANILQEALSGIPNCHDVFFVRTKEYQDIYADIKYLKDKNMYPFGFEFTSVGGYIFPTKAIKEYEKKVKGNVALSYSNIIKDDLYNEAKRTHYLYNGSNWAFVDVDEEKKNQGDKPKKIKKTLSLNNMVYDWMLLSRFKQKSNLYSALGTYAKLSLYKKNLAEFSKDYDGRFNEEGFFDIDKWNKGYKYYSIFESAKHYPSETLAFLEHERWNAFEIAFGVLPMKISTLVEKTNADYKKDNNNDRIINQIDGSYHSCICTQKGLVDYVKYLSQRKFTYKKQDYSFDREKTYDSDVIRYDYNEMNFYAQKENLEELEAFRKNTAHINVKGSEDV